MNTSWDNHEIGKPGERRFLIFGGVFNDFLDQVFVFNENLEDMSKSYCSNKPTSTITLPFKDKFYYQMMFKITEIPHQIFA